MLKNLFFKRFLAVVVFLTIAGYFFLSHKTSPADFKQDSLMTISGHTFKVETVADESSKHKGLGGRKSICSDCGMFFVFDKSGRYSFWMKDMFFSLDILWIKDDQIVFIAKDVAADFVGTITPTTEANRVLEINAGKVDSFGIKVGDKISEEKIGK